MKARALFPLGKAKDDAFCNRTHETSWLLNNIEALKHSLIIAPRRYGKSSLAEKVINQSKLPNVTLNFNSCSDEQDIEKLFRHAAGQLIQRLGGPMEKMIHSLKQYSQALVPKVVVGSEHFGLEFELAGNTDPIQSVEATLSLIENYLKDKNQQAVLLLDEFQSVGLIAKGKGVEAALRNSIQGMSYCSIIFSGSQRHLLQSMFDDSARPLYKLCRKLHLERMKPDHYRPHLNQAALDFWKEPISDDALEAIMKHTALHPYYMNYLCDIVWTICDSVPQANDIHRAWRMVLEEEHSDIQSEISHLSLRQKKVLTYIAQHGGEELYGSRQIRQMNLPSSTLKAALKALVEADFIENTEDGYTLISPAVRDVLRNSLDTL